MAAKTNEQIANLDEPVLKYIYDDLNDPGIMEDRESWAGKGEIAKFYSGKHIFITGSTGFMGLVLVEKLLRSCPDLAGLYLLIRTKKGKSIEERLNDMFDNVLFDSMKRLRGDSYKAQIIPILGDVGEKDLGISLSDRNLLKSQIEVIFHCAANVTFDKPLKLMTHVNVRGTKCVVELGKDCKRLVSLVYVSTAYSNCLKDHIGEKFYEPAMDPDKLIELVDNNDDTMLESITKQFVGKYPNTYTITKQITEDVIKKCGLPACVFRPSIVSNTISEPIRGWSNNFYGPTGVGIGIGMGFLRALQMDKSVLTDLVPVDMAINAMLASAWEVASTWTSSSEARVYNFVSSRNAITWGDWFNWTVAFGNKVIPINVAWHVFFFLNKSYIVNLLLTIYLHFLPGFLIDTYRVITGKKPKILALYRKIFKLNNVLTFFTMRQWKFDDNNLYEMNKRLCPADKKGFPMDVTDIDWETYAHDVVRGLRVYVVKDDLSSVPAAMKRAKKLKILHYFVMIVWHSLLAWVMMKIFGIYF